MTVAVTQGSFQLPEVSGFDKAIRIARAKAHSPSMLLWHHDPPAAGAPGCGSLALHEVVRRAASVAAPVLLVVPVMLEMPVPPVALAPPAMPALLITPATLAMPLSLVALDRLPRGFHRLQGFTLQIAALACQHLFHRVEAPGEFVVGVA